MKQIPGAGRLNEEMRTGAKDQKMTEFWQKEEQSEGGSATKHRREHH